MSSRSRVPIIIGGVLVAIIVGGIIVWIRMGTPIPPTKPKIVEMKGKIILILKQMPLMWLFQVKCDDGKVRSITYPTTFGYVLGEEVIIDVDTNTDSIVSMRPA